MDVLGKILVIDCRFVSTAIPVLRYFLPVTADVYTTLYKAQQRVIKFEDASSDERSKTMALLPQTNRANVQSCILLS